MTWWFSTSPRFASRRGFIRIGFSTSGSSLILGESEDYDSGFRPEGGRDSEPLPGLVNIQKAIENCHV